MSRPVASFALAASVVSVLAAPAFAAGLSGARFIPPGSPFAGSSPEAASVAMNSRGDVLVGEELRTANGTRVAPSVRVRSGPRGAWSGSIRLARPTTDTSTPIVALGERGAAGVAFTRGGRYVASRRRGTAWRLTSIGAPAPATDDVTALAVNGAGRARFAQALPDMGCDPGPAACAWTVSVYDQAAPGALWLRDGDSLRIAATQRPALALNRRGDLLIAWSTPDGSARVNASRRLATEAAFEAPQAVSLPGVRGDVHAALGNGGDAALAWVVPDAPGPGSTTGFTGRVDVSVRRRTSPTWAAAETVVPPGAANADVEIAEDAAGNVLLTWTTFATSPAAPDTLNASVRPAATGQWTASPQLDFADTGSGEALTILRTAIERGRAFVSYQKDLGPGGDIQRLASGTVVGGWRAATLTGNADVGAPGATPRHLLAVAPNGRAVMIADGLQVRNEDGLATPPAARASSPSVRVTGRSAVLTFRLNVASRVFVQRRAGPNFRTVGEYPSQRLGAGANTFRLGRLAPGRYLVSVGACDASRGCTASRFVSFRIRR